MKSTKKYFCVSKILILILLLPITTLGQTWTISVIDNNGIVGEYPSITLDQNDSLWVTYYNEAGQKLRVAHKLGNSWSTSDILSSITAGSSSIVFDNHDRPSITVSDLAHTEVTYIGWLPLPPTASISTIDEGNNSGQYVSLVADNLNNLAVTYFSQLATEIRFAKKEGPNWSYQWIYRPAYSPSWTSLAVDSINRISVVLFDSVSNSVKYIGWLPVSPKASLSVIDSLDDPGRFVSISHDALNNLSVSYTAQMVSEIRYSRKNVLNWSIQKIAQLDSTPSWTSNSYDLQNHPNAIFTDLTNSQVTYTGPLALPPKANIEIVNNRGNVGEGASMIIDNSGKPFLSYYDATYQNLLLSYKSSTGWVSIGVDSSGDVGNVSSVQKKSDGNLGIAYNDLTNGLVKYARAFADSVQRRFFIEGYIKEIYSNIPIANANVKIRNQRDSTLLDSTKSWANGYYNFPNIPGPRNEPIVISVKANGYQDFEEVVPTITPPNDTVLIWSVIFNPYLNPAIRDGSFQLLSRGHDQVAVTFPNTNAIRLINLRDCYYAFGITKYRNELTTTMRDINSEPLLKPNELFLGYYTGVWDTTDTDAQANDLYRIDLVSGRITVLPIYENSRQKVASANMKLIIKTLISMTLGGAGDAGQFADELIKQAELGLYLDSSDYVGAAKHLAEWVMLNKNTVGLLAHDAGYNITIDEAERIVNWIHVGFVLSRFFGVIFSEPLDQMYFEKILGNPPLLETRAYPSRCDSWNFFLPITTPTSLYIDVRNVGASVCDSVWVGLDIRDPFGKKIENTKTPIPDDETGLIGGLDFEAIDTLGNIYPQGATIHHGEEIQFRTHLPYNFTTSITGHKYRGGNYSYEYAVWSGGYPGQTGARRLTSLIAGSIITRDHVAPEAPPRLVHYYDRRSIVLSWEKSLYDVNSDTLYDLDYYQIYRSNYANGTYLLIGIVDVDELQSLPILFEDTTITVGNNYFYRVKAIDNNGNQSNFSSIDTAIYNPPVGVSTSNNVLPTIFSLQQNYPNPFNPITKIKFDIPKETFVSLRIYNLLGQEVAVLVNDKLPAGRYESEFNSSKLASGIYFYRLIAGDYIKTKKLLLLR